LVRPFKQLSSETDEEGVIAIPQPRSVLDAKAHGDHVLYIRKCSSR